MNDRDKVISLDSEFDAIKKNLENTSKKSSDLQKDINEIGNLCDDFEAELKQIPGIILPVEPTSRDSNSDLELEKLNTVIDNLITPDFRDPVHLTATDTTVAITAGIIATIIDIAFVGTPEVVKLAGGKENFDGSILTSALRKIGKGDDGLSDMLSWLSNKCKVPYDISAVKGVVCPDNHRLRSFAHDPLVGSLFAVMDIVLGTATLVDNEGKLRIIVNDTTYRPEQKILSLAYYLGHLLSDVCTARGIPIPGFILTQFFADGNAVESLAKKAELMYKDGYDIRHLASMSTPVYIKNLIIDIYLTFFKPENCSNDHSIIKPIAESEIMVCRICAHKYRLVLVSDAVSCSGNALKFFLPPTMGNITALNLPEWISLIKNTVTSLKYQLRDKDVEKVIISRDSIKQNWLQLLE